MGRYTNSSGAVVSRFFVAARARVLDAGYESTVRKAATERRVTAARQDMEEGGAERRADRSAARGPRRTLGDEPSRDQRAIAGPVEDRPGVRLAARSNIGMARDVLDGIART
jgi:hypothetical protein